MKRLQYNVKKAEKDLYGERKRDEEVDSYGLVQEKTKGIDETKIKKIRM